MTDRLTVEQLTAYLARIGHAPVASADLAALRSLHRAHALSIPFENLDTQLGSPPPLDPGTAFAKLVGSGRGGWCYEQNGVFGRALAALGFAVTRLSAGVMRQERGDEAMGSHLCLKVTIDGQDWLADVGFGSTLLDPLPLAEGTWDQGALAGTMTRTDDGMWRMAITRGPMPLSYDFRDCPADEAQLDALCTFQGRDAASLFVQNLVVQLRRADGHAMLRGKVLTLTGPDGSHETQLASADDLVATLRDRFGLDLPAAAGLWSAVEARHAALFDQSSPA